jgi:hypothetical protein
MALDEIARLENIQVPAYQIEEQIQSLKDQAAKEGQSDEVDDEQIRKKVESTLERRMVFDFLAEHADLEVEYMTEDEEKFDEALMEKLAQESIEREQTEESGKDEAAAESAVVVAAAPVAEVEAKVEAVEEEIKVETVQPVKTEPVKEEPVFEKGLPSYEGLNLEEKAFAILTNLGMAENEADDVITRALYDSGLWL